MVLNEFKWPGYTTAYVEIVLPAQCNRQLLAQLVSRELLVWATILQVCRSSKYHKCSLLTSRIRLSL